MTRGEFHGLLTRVEAKYRGRPEALERSTTRWVRLGQAGVALWLLFLYGIAGLVFLGSVLAEPPGGLIFLGIGIAVTLYAIAQTALFLHIDSPRPDGRELRPGEAPELVALLDDLRRTIGCRPFDEVRISLDFNAGVSEVPRLGIFGWSRTLLEVGLPLLAVVTPDELRAILAHEFAHMSARHGRGGLRIHRLLRMWSSLFARLQKPGAGSFRRGAHWVALKFVGWYWPRLQARSLALSRHHEFHADRVAADVAGAPAMVSALWRLECRNPWFADRFWPDVRKGAVEAPEPPSDVLDRLRNALSDSHDPAEAARWVERALGRRTSHDETHPAFFDRARSLGFSESEVMGLGFLADPPRPEALSLLGVDLEPILREQSGRWRDVERASWRERNRRAAAEARRKAKAVRAPGSTESPAPEAPQTEDVAALWASARELADLRGLDEAEPLLRSILETSPGHAGASVLLGHHRLGLGDPEGERLLWAVADSGDEQWTPSACQALEIHYRASGRTDRQKEARDRLDRHEAEIEKAQAERSAIAPGDPLLPHGLTDGELEPLRALLNSRRDCGGAWLARKDVRYFPDRRLYLLTVRAPLKRWGFADSEANSALVRALIPKVQLPGQVMVMAPSGTFGRIAKRVIALPGSAIFPREPGAASEAPAEADRAFPIS